MKKKPNTIHDGIFMKSLPSTRIIYLIAVIILPFLIQLLDYQSEYLIRIATMAGVYVILALGLSLILGYTGQLSMGHAAFYGIGAYTAALLSLHLNFPFWLTIPIAGLMGCLFGFLLGLPTLRVKRIICYCHPCIW